jgi:putative transposase
MVTQGLSERRALTVVRMSAAALRYVPRPDLDPGLRDRIVALAHRHRRYGAGMICLKLRQEGRLVNHKRVDRLYAEAVAVVPARALGGLPVTRILDRLAIERGLPGVLRTDNGAEFCGRAMLTWARTRAT